MAVYYNENNAFAASWLRELIKANVIAQGDVDERSIEDVLPSDLEGYKQCHFFAGIGVWSYALRQASWSDDREVWTGSCPCQPFSAAGQRKGSADERHLWPAYFHLLEKSRPSVIFGEQVASKDGLTWLDLVQTDLEAAGYTVGAVDSCAAGFGAPHIRQRLYFVGDADNKGSQRRRISGDSTYQRVVGQTSLVGELADTEHTERRTKCKENGNSHGRNGFGRGSDISRLAHTNGGNTCTEGLQRSGEHGQRQEDGSVGISVANPKCGRFEESDIPIRQSRQDETASVERRTAYWSAVDWIPCIDGKERPVEPGTFPLAHGVANRVGLLRGYGNAIVAPQAQAFIEAYLETI